MSEFGPTEKLGRSGFIARKQADDEMSEERKFDRNFGLMSSQLISNVIPKEKRPTGPESRNWATKNAPDTHSTMEAVKVQLLYEQREAFLAYPDEEE